MTRDKRKKVNRGVTGLKEGGNTSMSVKSLSAVSPYCVGTRYLVRARGIATSGCCIPQPSLLRCCNEGDACSIGWVMQGLSRLVHQEAKACLLQGSRVPD